MNLAGWLLTTWILASTTDSVQYNEDIRPLLSKHCFACHGFDEGSRKADLRLDRRQDVLDHRAPVITPHNSSESLLIDRITRDDSKRMPPEHAGPPMSKEEVELLRQWIDEGAAYDDHWGFQKPEVPDTAQSASDPWVRDPLDGYVLDALQERSLSPSAEADRYSLIRRVSLDLIGLPPTAEEVEAFVLDSRANAYEKAVDRLLSSPHFGERWAQVWLDVARYADSAGYGSDPLRTIYRYRDWVIEAFNSNKRFDRFTVEQLAGDLLENPTADQLLATAFHRNTMTNTEGGTDDEEFRVEAVKDRVHTTGLAWMGLTFRCAQCHSHKYDPISHREYYEMFAFFNQTEDADRPNEQPLAETPTREQQRKLDELADAIEELEAGFLKPSATLDQRMASWVVQRHHAPEYTHVAWGSFTAESQVLAPQADDGIYRVESRAEKDVYRIAIDDIPENTTALRLDVFPGDPAPGPSDRPRNRNFVLNELRARWIADKPSPKKGRFVRVDLPGRRRILSLAEVEIFSRGNNVATGGTATQSSTGFNGPANKAIDGNTSGIYDEKSVTHTNTQKDPYWEVDLGEVHPIDRVVLWNRVDGNLESRLEGYRVSILDEEKQTVAVFSPKEVPRPLFEIDVATSGQTVPIARASADFEQTDFGVDKANDRDQSPQKGWAVAPHQDQPHYAIFAFEGALRPAEGQRLEVELLQKYGGHHTIEQFRLSFLTGDGPWDVLPKPIESIVNRSEGERSEEEWKSLRLYFRTRSPDYAQERAQLDDLRTKKDAFKVARTPVMKERGADNQRKTHVLVKGNFLIKGEEVEAGTPASLHAFPVEAPRNRLGLAQWLLSEDNPLTSRVAVNRFWACLFGLGIVESEEDFGTKGTLPSNPKLLDYLALDFASDWDIKRFLKKLVLSATYRQSADYRADASDKDPRNRLLWRFPRQRLTAEMIRDQSLLFSGLLSPKMFGPSVYPYQPPGLWQAAFNGQRNWSTSQGEDRYRRGLYTYWRRTVPYPSMAIFDAPSREVCSVRRLPTNTPLQAFVTLNDPSFVEAAQGLARRILERNESSDERIRWVLRRVAGRPPSPVQVDLLRELYESERAHYASDSEAALKFATSELGALPEGVEPSEAAAWTLVSNVLLNLDCLYTKG